MRKLWFSFIIGVILAGVCTLGFNYKKVAEPNYYYKVYMNNETLGVIKSKDELEKYQEEFLERLKGY